MNTMKIGGKTLEIGHIVAVIIAAIVAHLLWSNMAATILLAVGVLVVAHQYHDRDWGFAVGIGIIGFVFGGMMAASIGIGG